MELSRTVVRASNVIPADLFDEKIELWIDECLGQLVGPLFA